MGKLFGTYKCAPLIFSELGADVATIHAEPNGTNIAARSIRRICAPR